MITFPIETDTTQDMNGKGNKSDLPDRSMLLEDHEKVEMCNGNLTEMEMRTPTYNPNSTYLEEEESFLGLTSELSQSQSQCPQDNTNNNANGACTGTNGRRKRSSSPILKGIKDKGILIHGLQQLFEKIDEREEQENRIVIVKCSYFEIYNDQVYDLLNEEFATTHEALQVIEDPKRKDFYVRNLRETIVENLDECLSLLKLGELNRSYAATKMNHHSSRSHALYRLSVQSMPRRDS